MVATAASLETTDEAEAASETIEMVVPHEITAATVAAGADKMPACGDRAAVIL
jgi:hypothetical protein